MLRSKKQTRTPSLFLYLFAFAFLGACGGETSKFQAPSKVSSFSDQAIEVLLTNTESQECSPEKKKYILERKSDLAKNISAVFPDPSKKSLDKKEVDKVISALASKQLETSAKRLAVILKSHAKELDNSLKLLFGDTSLDLNEEQLWKLVQIGQYKEWPELDASLRKLIKGAEEKNPEATQFEEIIKHLSHVASSDEGKEALGSLLSSDFASLPSEEQIWKLLQISLKPEFKKLVSRLQLGINEVERPSPETQQMLNIVERIRQFATTEEGEQLNQVFAQDLSVLAPSKEQLNNTIQFVQRKDVQKFAASLGKVFTTLKNEVALGESAFPIPYFSFKNVDEESLWKLLSFAQTDEASSLKPLPDEKEALQKHVKRIREILLSPNGRFVRSHLNSQFAQNLNAENALPWVPYLAQLKEDLDEPKLHAAVTRIRKFPFTDDGRRVMSYAKRFITDKATRDFMVSLGSTGQGYHGGWLEWMGGLELCLHESISGWSLTRWLCAQNMGLFGGLDRKLTVEALDFGALVYKNGIIDDLLLLEKSYGKKEPQKFDDPKALITALDEFFADEQNTKATKLAFEFIFEREGLGETLDELAEVAKSYYARNKTVLDKLAQESGFSLESLSKSHVELALQVLRDETSVDILLFLPEFIAEFEEGSRLLSEFGKSALGNREISREQFSQFIALLKDDNHEKAARILLDCAKQKNTFADTLSFGAFLSDFIDRHKDDIQFIEQLNKEFGLSERMVEALYIEKNSVALLKLSALNKNHNIINDLLKLNTIASTFLSNHKAEIDLLDAVRERLGLTIKATSRERAAKIYQIATDKKSKDAVLALAKFALSMGEFSLSAGNLLKAGEQADFFKVVQKLKHEDVSSAFSLARFSVELMSMKAQNTCKVSLPTKVSSIPIADQLNSFADFLTDSKFGFVSWLSVFRNVAKDNQK